MMSALRIVTTIPAWLGIAVLASMLTIFATPTRAESVAIITDLAGKASIQGKSATILTEIEADARVQLDAGARLVAMYFKSGDEYNMSGPALIEFRAKEPVAASGAKPAKRGNPLAQGGAAIRIRPGSVAQAAVVMRSGRPAARIRLLSLSGTRVLETQLEFRWQELQPGLKYHFEITDDTGHALHEAQVDVA